MMYQGCRTAGLAGTSSFGKTVNSTDGARRIQTAGTYRGPRLRATKNQKGLGALAKESFLLQSCYS